MNMKIFANSVTLVICMSIEYNVMSVLDGFTSIALKLAKILRNFTALNARFRLLEIRIFINNNIKLPKTSFVS